MTFLRILETQTSSRLQGLGFLGVVEAGWQSGVAGTGFKFHFWHWLAV